MGQFVAVGLVISVEDVRALRQPFGPALQVPDAVVVDVGELAHDVATAALRERAAHTFVRDVFDQAQVDAVVDPPRLEDLFGHGTSLGHLRQRMVMRNAMTIAPTTT